MPLFLLIVGALLALLGLGSIAAGAPDWVLGLSLGATLIQSGTIALVGGLILIALGMVLQSVQDLLRRLEAPAAAARPAIMPPEERAAASRAAQARASLPPQQPEAPSRVREREAAEDDFLAREPAEPPRVRRERREPVVEAHGDDLPPAAEPRARRERPRETHSEEIARPRRPVAAPPAEEPVRANRPAPPSFEEEEPARPRARSAEPVRETAPRPRGDRPREPAEEAPRPRREFTPIPTIPQPFGSGEGGRAPQPGRGGEPSEPPPPKFRPVEPAPAPASAPARPGSETVVRSGVIGGMAYTLYVDGSIEAELPIGTVRFNSIAELQDHVMRTGAEADSDFDEQNR